MPQIFGFWGTWYIWPQTLPVDPSGGSVYQTSPIAVPCTAIERSRAWRRVKALRRVLWEERHDVVAMSCCRRLSVQHRAIRSCSSRAAGAGSKVWKQLCRITETVSTEQLQRKPSSSSKLSPYSFLFIDVINIENKNVEKHVNARSTQPSIPPGRSIEYRPAWLGLRQGAFTFVEWKVTLCDPTWQVTLRSS